MLRVYSLFDSHGYLYADTVTFTAGYVWTTGYQLPHVLHVYAAVTVVHGWMTYLVHTFPTGWIPRTLRCYRLLVTLYVGSAPRSRIAVVPAAGYHHVAGCTFGWLPVTFPLALRLLVTLRVYGCIHYPPHVCGVTRLRTFGWLHTRLYARGSRSYATHAPLPVPIGCTLGLIGLVTVVYVTLLLHYILPARTVGLPAPLLPHLLVALLVILAV